MKGLGDTVEKIAKTVGADKVATVYEQVTCKKCGCAGRRDKLNSMFPYNNVK